MSVIEILHKALEALKSEKAWYDFDFHFWSAIDSKQINIKLLTNTRQTLAFLNSEFERQLRRHCKHADRNSYELFEHCNECRATRSRDKNDDLAMWNTYSAWSDWYW